MNLRKTLSVVMLLTLSAQSLGGLVNLTDAASTHPFIQTRISVAADGGVPMDNPSGGAVDCSGLTYDPLTQTNTSKDSCATNGVVRLTDMMRYKVEVTVNDAANQGDLVAVVHLDPNNTISQPRQKWKGLPDTCLTSGSFVSMDAQTLTCNLGSYREGTNAIFYPEAIVTQYNRNGDHIHASVSSYTTDGSSNIASDGPTDTITTAGFGVDLVKTLKPPYQNISGDIIYLPDFNVALDGSAGGTGYMITYRISADYANGSSFVSGDSNNKVSYTLSDVFSYLTGYLGTGVLFAGCDVNGANATAVCPTIGTPLLASSTGATFPIQVNDIDISQPVNDKQVFSIDVKYWVPMVDIKPVGNPLINSNYVYFNGGTIVDANLQPVSQDNVPNYNGAGENVVNNGLNYPMYRVNAGSTSFKKTFWGWSKNGKKKATYGEIITMHLIQSTSYTQGDQMYYHCDNIDNTKLEYVGMLPKDAADPSSFNASSQGPNPWMYFSLKAKPGATIPYYMSNYGNGNYANYPAQTVVDPHFIKIEYSSVPHTANTASATPQKDSTCEDDMNSDGQYDWTTDPDTLAGGKPSVTKIRVTIDADYSWIKDRYGIPGSIQFGELFQFKVLESTDQAIIPNYALSTSGNANTGWYSPVISTDPMSPSYSLEANYADRLTVVAAKASIFKTLNAPTSVASPGDILNFTITPVINGDYIPSNGTISGLTITDTLPANSSLIDWTANCPSGQSITTSGSMSGLTLVWNISGASIGSPLCTINYNLKVSGTAPKGWYLNKARIDVCSPTSGSDCGIYDKDIDPANNEKPIQAMAGYTVVSKGVVFDVKKDVSQDFVQLNTPFDFTLSYANMGVENFSDAKVIDILPYNGDGVMTGTSGPNTARDPATLFHGGYQLTSLTPTNGEYGFEVTDADPRLISLDASSANNTVAWTACATPTTPNACLTNITAIRRSVPATSLAAGAMRKNITLTLTPTGNLSGDIYTNSFSAKVPEMSFPVISNDVSVTVVAGSIGDTVWIDDNSDGIIDTGESLLPNVPVTLFSSTGAVIATGMTDSLGQYLFTGLVAGSYTVTITPPAGMVPTYDLDSGTGNLAGLDNSTLVTLVAQRDPINNKLVGVSSNMTADFGLYSNLASIAGHVYYDVDVNSGYETTDTYLSGIEVQLLSGGVVIATGSTNASGEYLFPAVVPGVYDISYNTPSGYNPYTSIGGTGSVIAGHGSLALPGQSGAGVVSTLIQDISVISKEHSINNDFGLVTPYDLAIIKTSDIGTGSNDSTVTYTITYGNMGGTPVSNVVVQDIWPSDYLSFVSASMTPSSPTTPTVQDPISWNVGSLGIGQTGSIVITATIKAGLASGTVVVNTGMIYSSDDSSKTISGSSITGTQETTYSNNTTSTNQITADTDLVIAKSTNTPFVIKGDTLDWTIDYRNDGPQTANDVVIYDFLPNGLQYESSSYPNPVIASVTGGTQISWLIGQLLAGQHGQITLITRATDSLLENTPIYNTAVISGSTTERTTINNVALAQTMTATATGSFDGYVWYDSDNSTATGNTKGDTELAASGIIVEIYNLSGVKMMTLTTDSDGRYVGVLPIGEYKTNIIIPNHYTLTTANNTPFTILRDAVRHVDDDGLYHKPGSFTATVWYDDDSSQTKNNGEPPVRIVPVQVYDYQNRLIGTYVTNEQGRISGSLIPGEYRFVVSAIDNYDFTTISETVFTILSEQSNHIYDVGIVRIPVVPTNSGGGKTSTPVSTSDKPVVAPSKPVEPVHQAAPTKAKVETKPQTKPQTKAKLTLDRDLVIEQVHSAPDLTPRTFVIPEILLDTGTPEAALQKKGVAVRHNPKVETQMADWIKPVSADVAATMTLDDWIARMPQEIRDQINLDTVQQWIVVPSLGIVAPVDDIPQDTSDWSTLVNGGDIKVNPYLKKGVVHYPLSANAGEIGNMIIAGHSSYFKADDGLFKTIFTSLPLLNVGDEVLVYKKKTAEEYKKELEMTSSSSKKSWDATTKVEPFAQFSYVIRNSYEIKSTDTWILNSRPQTSHLTVFTCTPIGSNKNRWYIDAELR